MPTLKSRPNVNDQLELTEDAHTKGQATKPAATKTNHHSGVVAETVPYSHVHIYDYLD